MKINKLSANQVVYMIKKVDSDILKSSKSQKKYKTIEIIPVYIQSVHEEKGYVMAKIGNGKIKKCLTSIIGEFKKNAPATITDRMGITRLATKKEKEKINN